MTPPKRYTKKELMEAGLPEPEFWAGWSHQFDIPGATLDFVGYYTENLYCLYRSQYPCGHIKLIAFTGEDIWPSHDEQ